MTDVKHTKACLEIQAAAEAFEAKHPKYCRRCGGEGYQHHPGSRWEPPSDDPCSQCIEAGKCPLCASELQWVDADEDFSRCAQCGWDEQAIVEGKAVPEVCPDAECLCWEDENSY